MRKLLSVILSVSLVLSTVLMFASAVAAESKFNISEDADITAQLKAFTDIKALFTEAPVMTDIQALYNEKFQANVKVIDATIKADAPKIDENISLVLEQSVKGNLTPAQAKQAVDKGLQWYFYFLLKDYVNKQVKPALEAGNIAKAKLNFDKAVQIYEGTLQATVQKRDNTFNTIMQDTLDKVVIPLIQADIESGNVNDFNVHRQMLDKTLIKVFTLALVTYAQNIPTKPVADQPAAMTEAYFFYMPVYAYLRGGSAEDADYVHDIFAAGDATKVDTDKIKAALERTLIGKVSEYTTNSFVKLEAKDLQAARGYAYEGIMFVAALETFLGTDYAAIQQLSEQYRDAVDHNDLASAKKAAFQIVSFLVKTDGIELQIGTSSVAVDGALKEVTAASYVNADTNRTLVPVRVIAEAVQAEVTYVAETKTVNIVKDGHTTELVVNSDKIIQDGVESTTVILDQHVTIKDGYSYVPLRAVAELFGKKVFYDSGKVIILR
jgi:hypothetical protein